jgi:carbonic anhydrase
MNLLLRTWATTLTTRTLPRHFAACACAPPPPPTTPTSPTSSTSPAEPEPDIKILMDNNKSWVREQKRKDPDFFTKLGSGQAPKYLYIGCSDSRVPANEILGLPAGDVFVHRNVGNLVVGTDLNVLSVLEYAVDHLDVKHIIVTGHYDCGAVKAAVETQDLGLVENWLRNIRDVYRLHFSELDLLDNTETKHRRLVELNVIEQCLNIYKTGVVQRKRMKTFNEAQEGVGDNHAYPRIHGMVFDPGDGLLKKLPVSFRQEIQGKEHIYNLYKSQDLKERNSE